MVDIAREYMIESIVERIQKFLLSCLPEKGQPTMTVLRIKDVLVIADRCGFQTIGSKCCGLLEFSAYSSPDHYTDVTMTKLYVRLYARNFKQDRKRRQQKRRKL